MKCCNFLKDVTYMKDISDPFTLSKGEGNNTDVAAASLGWCGSDGWTIVT